MSLPFAHADACRAEIVEDLLHQVGVAGPLEIEADQRSRIVAGPTIVEPELFGRPKPEQLVPATAHLETQLLVEFELRLVSLLDFAEPIRHLVPRSSLARPRQSTARRPNGQRESAAGRAGRGRAEDETGSRHVHRRFAAPARPRLAGAARRE